MLAGPKALRAASFSDVWRDRKARVVENWSERLFNRSKLLTYTMLTEAAIGAVAFDGPPRAV